MLSRPQLRSDIRRRRQLLSASEQQQAATNLVSILLSSTLIADKTKIAIYLSNDSEIDTGPLIEALWLAGKTLYVPVLHPFCSGYLLFQKYEPSTPSQLNRFGITEPKLNCATVLPVQQFELIFTPLVAFDDRGQRLGMGGGFYDRTLSQLPTNHAIPLVGLAHDCQQIQQVPTESWDQPLHAVVTGSRLLDFRR